MTQVRARIRTPDRPCADGLGLSAISLNRCAVPREIAFWLIAYLFAAALGPLMAGLFAQFLPRPTVLVFEVS